MPHKIVMVEDSDEVQESLKVRLQWEGFEVLVTSDTDQALGLVTAEKPDVVILDLTIPVADEVEICQLIRREAGVPQLPILILSGRGESVDKVFALEHGADEFLTKPCDPPELVARVRALLRRVSPSPPSAEMKAGTIEIDVDHYRARVRGTPLKLTSKEFDLLKVLIGACGRVVRREELLERVWGYGRGSEVRSRTLDVHIRSLRRKLGLEGTRILTVRTVGYRLDVAPEWIQFGPERFPEEP